MTKPAALVTSARTRASYAIARSLALAGVPVYVADSTLRSMSFLSRYVRGRFLYPSPFHEPERFADCLHGLAAKHGISVLIPVMEETYTVAKYREYLGQRYKMAMADYDQLIQFHDKSRWAGLALAQGIGVPRTVPLTDFADSPSLRETMRFPVLLKPNQGGGGWAVREIGSTDELAESSRDSLCRGLPLSRFSVQEKIDGKTICVAMLYDRGKAIAKVVYEQLRNFPPPFGQATLRKTICGTAAEQCMKKLLDAHAWNGVCQADFVLEQGSGRPYLVDINPRFWGSVALAVAADVNFPHLLYRIALGEQVAPIGGYALDVYCRWLGGDLAAWLSNLWSREIRQKTRRKVSTFNSAPMSYDDFSLGDPLPFLGWCADAAISAIAARTYGSPAHDTLDGVWE